MRFVYCLYGLTAISATLCAGKFVIWMLLLKTTRFSKLPKLQDFARNGDYQILEKSEIIVKKIS